MTEIHYFPRYTQRENFVTNNTLLLLLRLYHYNRFKYEKFMEALCADQDIEFTSSSLQFRQQVGTGPSVVDGFIAQDSIKIAVETKLDSAFDVTQLENHLKVFGDEQHKLLVLLSTSREAISTKHLETIQAEAARHNIQVFHTSFEGIVDQARNCLSEHDEEMHALVDDYESFCSDESLLPRDKYTLFVPPCPQSFNLDIEFSLYYCPVTYSRRKAKYLGIYARKTIRAIGRIAKVVACDVDPEADMVMLRAATGELTDETELTEQEERRILGVTRKAKEREWDISVGYKFYLCDEMLATDFRKTSLGGMMGHRYFDLKKELGGEVPESIAELVTQLRQRNWEWG